MEATLRHGSNIDAASYLQKFYSVVLSLSRKVLGDHDYLRYFDDVSRQFRISISICEAAHGLLASYGGSTPMTPKTVQRNLTVLALVPQYNKRPDLHDHPDILAGAAIAKVCAPQIYQEMRFNELNIGELAKVFYLEDSKIEYWKHVIHSANGKEIPFTGDHPRILPYALQRTCEELLEVFDTSALQIT